MKKIFTLIAAAAMSLAAMATDYAGTLTVSINGEGASQPASITVVMNEDSTYKLSINNFTLESEDTTLPVGNIVLDNMKAYSINGVNTIVADQIVTIAEGNDPDVEMWFGPFLGEVPIIMAAQFDETNLKVDIDIDMRSVLEQFINVKFNTQAEAIYGDVNNDGSVNAGDVTAVYNIILGN